MDLTAVDLTGHPKVRAGDEVTLLDADPASGISAQAIAGMTGTIPYEVMTSIGSRVTRSYVDFQ
jgi:alanine racemase